MMLGFLKLQGEDFVAFIMAAFAGYVAGSFITDPDWAAYVSILVSYHPFLTWLVINSPGKFGLSMPAWSSALTHAACMVVALGPVGFTNHTSMGFGLFRYSIAAIALFEHGWVFSKEEAKPALDDKEATAVVGADISATASDEIAWLEHLRRRRPGMTKPGITIRQEHDAWLCARLKTRQRAQAAQVQPQHDQQPVAAELSVSNP
jgi:hypothetical protein